MYKWSCFTVYIQYLLSDFSYKLLNEASNSMSRRAGYLNQEREYAHPHTQITITNITAVIINVPYTLIVTLPPNKLIG